MYFFETIRCAFAPDELALCDEFARGRFEEKRRVGVTDKKVGKQDGYDVDYLGLRAELAFEKTFGVKLNQLTGLRGDGGHTDFTIDGKSISVKGVFAGESRQNLLVPEHQFPVTADYLVVVQEVAAGEPEVDLVGWTTGAFFNANCYHKQFVPGRPWTYAMLFSLLDSMTSFQSLFGDTDRLALRFYGDDFDTVTEHVALFRDLLDLSVVGEVASSAVEFRVHPECAALARTIFLDNLGIDCELRPAQ